MQCRESLTIKFLSSGNEKDTEEDYGLIRPSLIKQLRSILDQYPDDGQILKVQHQSFETTIYTHFIVTYLALDYAIIFILHLINMIHTEGMQTKMHLGSIRQLTSQFSGQK